jgi:hypothetical protein
MKLTQKVGLVGAILGSIAIALPAIAQTTNPNPSNLNPEQVERICAEYMNQNQNQAQTPTNRAAAGTTGTGSNRTGNTGRTAAGTPATGGNRAGNTGRTAAGTPGTTANSDSVDISQYTPEQLNTLCADFMQPGTTQPGSNRTAPSGTQRGNTNQPGATPRTPGNTNQSR